MTREARVAGVARVVGGGGGRGGLGGRGGGGGWGGEGGGGGQGGTTCMYIKEIVPVIEHTNLAERYASYDNHDQVNRSRRQNKLAQVGPLRRIQVKKNISNHHFDIADHNSIQNTRQK